MSWRCDEIKNEELLRMIANYNRLRDAAVIAAIECNDLEPLKALSGMSDEPLPSDDVLRIAARKMCLAITTMPEDLKQKAREWMREHGFREDIA